MSDEIRVNGNLYSWGSIKLKIGGEPFYGFTAISYADKRERTKGYGMGPHQAPLGRSRGKYTTEPVKLTGWTHAVQAARKALAALASDGSSYGDVEFEINVQYIEGELEPLNVVIERCVWVGNNTSNEEGADNMKEEVEIDCFLIRRNGMTLFDERKA